MKPIKKFVVGSQAFFKDMPGYHPHDKDILCIMDEWNINDTCQLNMKLDGEDVFFTKNMTKEEFIRYSSKDTPMRCGKFLVPEFAEWIGFTLDDLNRIKPVLDKIDNRHKYYLSIYDSYIKNNKFELTSAQRKAAYEIYKKERGL